jgi:hypothetical protein
VHYNPWFTRGWQCFSKYFDKLWGETVKIEFVNNKKNDSWRERHWGLPMNIEKCTNSPKALQLLFPSCRDRRGTKRCHALKGAKASHALDKKLTSDAEESVP